MTQDPPSPLCSIPEAAQPSEFAPRASRRPYQTPVVRPLGQWTALTLVNSLPIGAGGSVFGGPIYH